MLAGSIRLVPPGAEQARIAADASLRLPLNLGGCFAYALGVVDACPIQTVDEDFRRIDPEVVMPSESAGIDQK